jgi:glucose/arabinose dehydrogenase
MLPDGSSLITEKRGTLRNWRDNKLSAPLSGVPSVAFRGQGGLLDIALDPQFAENRIIYLSYAEAATSQPGGQDVADDRLGIFQELDDAVAKGLAVARAELSDDGLRNVRVIWRAEKTIGRGHFGGRMAFDRSGALLITSGDRQRFEPAQDVSSDLGKIIRIRSTDGASLPDNPFANAPNSQRDVWSFGHRNPLGIAVRPGSDEIWVAEMGPQNGDELNLLRRGGNFGWPLVSAGDNYNQTTLPRPSTRPDLIGAHAAFPIAVSPASLIFYQGTLFGPWRGDVLVGTLNRPGILRGKVAPDGVHDLEHLETGFRVRDLAQAPDGSILVLRDGADGGLFRLTPSKP